jgi:Tannase and feruloyl esterase
VHPKGGYMRKKHLTIATAVAAMGLATGLSVAGTARSSVTAAQAGQAAATRLSETVAADSAQQPVLPLTSCAALPGLNLDSVITGAPAQVTSAATVTYQGADYCQVSVLIAPQTQGQIMMPQTTWTGAYVQEGCGGQCGTVTTRPPSAAAGCAPVTANQLVFASDDEGHSGPSTIFAANDIELRTQYAYLSEHYMALITKAVIKGYYGSGPAYSYYDGCSTGGREALAEAERYPHDFQGILAGSPVSNLLALSAEEHSWVELANMAPDGKEILTTAQIPALHAAVMAACANSQGYIADPRSCGFNPASIQCPAGVTSDSCLTPAQVAAVIRIYRGPTDPHGKLLYPGGEPYGSELAWPGTFIQPASDTAWPFDTVDGGFAGPVIADEALPEVLPGFSFTQWKFTDSYFSKLQALTPLYDAIDPDLSAFEHDGGKLIIYQPAADQDAPPTATIDYYQQVVHYAGGFAQSQSFSRFYLVPGGYHCLGGGSPDVTGDLLTPLMQWVEHGQAPGTVSFPLLTPTPTLSAIPVSPLNPNAPPPGGAKGLNADTSSWIGTYSTKLMWCSDDGMSVSCRLSSRDPSS